MILHASTLFPFVRKVTAFAHEKNTALELRPTGLGRGGPECEEILPFVNPRHVGVAIEADRWPRAAEARTVAAPA